MDSNSQTDRCFTILQQSGYSDEEKNRKIVSLHCHTSSFFSGKITFDKQKHWYAKYCKSVKYTPIRWRCFWWNFTPPISQVTFAQIRGKKWGEDKIKIPDNRWLSGILFILHWLFVIRLGLEPKTPTLKVLCSTCWASESNLIFFLSKELLIKALNFSKASAVWTGLEPATPCVTGRYSNQLNYHTIWLLSFSIADAKVRIIF